MKTALLLVLAGFVAFAVAPPGAAEDEAATRTVPLKINQPVTIGDLELTLLDVGDSRCPQSVVCVWEGMAGGRIRARVRGVDPEEHVIYTHVKFDMKFEYGGHTVSMIGVTPYPVTPDPIDPADYTVSVRVSGNLDVVPTETGTWGAIKALYR